MQVLGSRCDPDSDRVACVDAVLAWVSSIRVTTAIGVLVDHGSGDEKLWRSGPGSSHAVAIRARAADQQLLAETTNTQLDAKLPNGMPPGACALALTTTSVPGLGMVKSAS